MNYSTLQHLDPRPLAAYHLTRFSNYMVGLTMHVTEFIIKVFLELSTI